MGSSSGLITIAVMTLLDFFLYNYFCHSIRYRNRTILSASDSAIGYAIENMSSAEENIYTDVGEPCLGLHNTNEHTVGKPREFPVEFPNQMAPATRERHVLPWSRWSIIVFALVVLALIISIVSLVVAVALKSPDDSDPSVER